MLGEAVPAIWASVYSWFTPTVLLTIVIGTIVLSSSLGGGGSSSSSASHNSTGNTLVRTSSVLDRFKSFNFYRQRTEDVHAYGSVLQPEFLDHQIVQQSHESSFHGENGGNALVRTSSILDRFKSFNLYRQRTEDVHTYSAVLRPEFQTHQAVLQTHELAVEETVVESEGKEEEEEVVMKDAEHHHYSRSASDTAPTAGEMPTKLPEKMKKSASTKSAFAHFKEEEVTGVRRPATTRPGKVGVKEDEEVDAKADDFINRFKQQLKLQRLDSIMRYKDMLNREK
ncbi:pathogen-associated molecular patterns-induced protein A70-like [Aristolochia californica]|uniref:pathogen-associated molecular patterns-induced protein A70-like n=1 Tax=Aristolochia californica TaxID=171875 RepID=UPI0035DF12C4